MITDEQIEEKAKDESVRNVDSYAPTSFKAGFIKGAKWIKELYNNGRDIY